MYTGRCPVAMEWNCDRVNCTDRTVRKLTAQMDVKSDTEFWIKVSS
jgi:hypothetical protein